MIISRSIKIESSTKTGFVIMAGAGQSRVGSSACPSHRIDASVGGARISRHPSLMIAAVDDGQQLHHKGQSCELQTGIGIAYDLY